MKGYVPQQLNTDRRFSVQSTSTVPVSDENNILPNNQDNSDIQT